ncbi:unnamed protein product [Sphenostylis stenocarpa]|uniref:Uncharacterized protein n=1 Tax=Sphenostylis stenocarpa TaxID=92480 RepID=A0AA86VSC2_9FABA|nr:unnamed protein product [Sphenostylis stenocarpa]
MGNCCTTESSMNWGGDDWGSLSSCKRRSMSSGKVFDEVHEMSLENVEKEKLLGALRASSDANGKVKIKISKKELAQLLGGKENNKQLGEEVHASAEQVLARLIHARDHASNDYNDLHHRPWRPVLQSIPEVN